MTGVPLSRQGEGVLTTRRMLAMECGFSKQGFVLVLGMTVAGALACAAGQSSQEPGRGDPGSGGSPAQGGVSVGATAGTGVSLGGSGGTSPGGSVDWIPDDLPAPWQYYDDGTERAYKDPALPDGVRELFSGADADPGELAIVYPLDGAMHAVNQGYLLLQWHRGDSANSLFRIDAVAEDGR